ncbi:sporulation-control protein [Bacillus oleivorans]|uniref:Sporulation-control protein n=1 Tax=Bacillus oleivorans TaxID=1448271 RepID=A0A285CT23_9BACI|nr:sporulation protein [Bacillus oleivorans]SNX70730.1 sporulation-control protein [Bacillus oleivorans]
MILRKYISLLGIGSAQIDLILEKETYSAGEEVKGYFQIKGGTVVQKLKRIECDLVMADIKEEKEETVETKTILTTKSIQSETDEHIPFRFLLPDALEMSAGTLNYHFRTRLVFDKGVESKDLDVIRIVGK